MDYPFTTDGCSGWMTLAWRKALRHDPPWEGCCEAHDKIYWVGGSAEARFKADCDLALCVAKSSRFWAVAIFLAVCTENLIRLSFQFRRVKFPVLAPEFPAPPK